jgi:hypothetical protein
MGNQIQQRRQLEQALLEKAMKDEAFRKQLLEHPRAVVEQETGVKLPKELHIRVLEETACQVYLVLPPIHKEVFQEELSEAELESVVGGTAGAETVETHWTYCNC